MRLDHAPVHHRTFLIPTPPRISLHIDIWAPKSYSIPNRHIMISQLRNGPSFFSNRRPNGSIERSIKRISKTRWTRKARRTMCNVIVCDTRFQSTMQSLGPPLVRWDSEWIISSGPVAHHGNFGFGRNSRHVVVDAILNTERRIAKGKMIDGIIVTANIGPEWLGQSRTWQNKCRNDQ